MPYKAKLTTRTLTASNVSSDNLNKGSELTFQQADSNFLNLRDQSIGIAADDSTTIDIGMGNTLKVAGSGTVTTAVSGQTLTITGTGGLGITVVGDDSTGTLISNGETIKIAGGTGITTAMSGDILTITATGGGGSGSLGDLSAIGSTLQSPSNAGITLQPSGTGNVLVDGYNGLVISKNSSPNQFSEITSDGNHGLRLSTNNFTTSNNTILLGSAGDGGNITLSASGEILLTASNGIKLNGNIKVNNYSIVSETNGNITITPNGTGSIVLDGLNWPQADGTNGQILSTNGAGQLSFITNNTSTGDLTLTGSQIFGPSNGDIDITPGGTGNLNLKTDTITIGETRGTQNFDTRIITKGITMITTNADDELNEPQIALIEYDRGASGGGGGNINIKSGKDYYNSERGRIELNTPRIYLGYTGTTSIEPGNNYDLQFKVQGTGRINIDAPTSTSIGANGAATALTANPVGYIKIKVAGTEYQIPYYNI